VIRGEKRDEDREKLQAEKGAVPKRREENVQEFQSDLLK
jgi:hypothetical protein